jgi:hypothetical protein
MHAVHAERTSCCSESVAPSGETWRRRMTAVAARRRAAAVLMRSPGEGAVRRSRAASSSPAAAAAGRSSVRTLRERYAAIGVGSVAAASGSGAVRGTTCGSGTRAGPPSLRPCASARGGTALACAHARHALTSTTMHGAHARMHVGRRAAPRARVACDQERCRAWCSCTRQGRPHLRLRGRGPASWPPWHGLQGRCGAPAWIRCTCGPLGSSWAAEERCLCCLGEQLEVLWCGGQCVRSIPERCKVSSICKCARVP